MQGGGDRIISILLSCERCNYGATAEKTGERQNGKVVRNEVGRDLRKILPIKS